MKVSVGWLVGWLVGSLTSQHHACVSQGRIYLFYLVLFVLQVAHKASTRARQRCRSAETRSRRPHVQPFSFVSLSTVLLQVSLGWPLFLWPSGVHRRAILVKVQGRMCSDNCTCCHTEIEVADQTFCLTQSQYTDTGPTSPSTDPITLGA